MEIASPDSASRKGGSVVSIDDPDVRIAAEALGDLRAGMPISFPTTNFETNKAVDFISSPVAKNTSSPTSVGQQTEPFLSLLTTSHPLLGSALNNSLSAYSRTKHYSPRFKSSAEYVERVSRPVVNTVGSVGRLTGVEGGVRWFLSGRRPSHHHPADLEEQGEGSSKRRRLVSEARKGDEEAILDTPDPYPVFRETQLQHRPRRSSLASSTVESLPAYDDHRSPNYEASVSAEDGALIPAEITTPGGSSWQSRLVLSTSGLSIAMSEESLRSLKYCLSWLRWANEHIGRVISALKQALEELDSSSSPTIKDRASADEEDSEKQLVTQTEAERSRLNARIENLKNDVLKTLKDVVDIVSKYAGGALPENARLLVRKHLTSLPQRFRLASASSPSSATQGDEEQARDEKGESQRKDRQTSEAANRVLVLAKEGLDMMAQVSGVVDGTIVSAEEWCERLGRRKREEGGRVDVERDEGRDQEGEEEGEEPPLRAGIEGLQVDAQHLDDAEVRRESRQKERDVGMELDGS